jgi:FkbM family methyltransferase
MGPISPDPPSRSSKVRRAQPASKRTYVLNKLTKLVACLFTRPYARALIRHRVAAGIDHESVLRGLNFQTVIDVGANRGQFALVARRCFPKARIISFEPLPQPAARFNSVFAADGNATLRQAAIGPEPGHATIHISGRDDSSSLLPITARQDALFPGTAQAGVASVQVGPLDAFVSTEDIVAPALLKLDVQGYELEALKGCAALLGRFAYVYVECSFVELYARQALADEVIAWLRERGVRLQGVYNMSYDRSGRAIQADFLFARG